MKYISTWMTTAGMTLALLTFTGCTVPEAVDNSGSTPPGRETLMNSAEVGSADWLEGEAQPLGDGTVRAYVVLDGQEIPQEVGVIVTAAALRNLPPNNLAIVVPLPPQVTATAIDHITVDWQPHGHRPEPIYGSSHFDIHAYLISPQQRDAITAQGSDLEKAYKTPADELIPVGYVLAPDSAEPRMGAHWINPTAEEFQGDPHGFSHTLIYGFYDGVMTFVEPMVTLDFLNGQTTVEQEFARPERYGQPGLYPTRYRITYHPETQEHRVALLGFVAP
jgi:hypothetical protein